MPKKSKSFFAQLRHEWKELDLACKGIFIIGGLLLLELVCSIFIGNFSHHANISMIFRTSLSSIFGYILGMNVLHNEKKTNTPKNVETTPTASSTDESTETTPILKASNIRSLFAIVVCVVCMVALVTADFTNHVEYQDGITQLGHLISTTIGFLVSTSNHAH